MEIWDGRSARGKQDFAEYILRVLNPPDVLHAMDEIESGLKLPPRGAEFLMDCIAYIAGIPVPMPGDKDVAPKAIRAKVSAAFQSTLRSLTDQWIESGQRNGIEEPFERSVRFKSHKFPETIEHTLVQFWNRNPPIVQFDRNLQVISTQSLLRQSSWLPLAGESTASLLERAREHARAFFAMLMDSPSRYRIFRCENCRSYYLKNRTPKGNRPIKRGRYCDLCKGEASKRRVKEARERRMAQMLHWAVDAKVQWAADGLTVVRWKQKNRSATEVEWIVKIINANLKIENLDPIRSNWVNWNSEKIEELWNRRSHGTS